MKEFCKNCDAQLEPGISNLCRQCYWPIEKTEKAQNFTKHNEDKVRYGTMVQFEFLEEVARVGNAGSKKYSEYNWTKATSIQPWIDATYRHLNAFVYRGEDTNAADFGYSHLAHAVWNLLTLMWFMKYKPECDDRFSKNGASQK